MTGRCAHCRYKTMALPGAQDRFSRAYPPDGFRLGWVLENSDSSKLICYRCIAYKVNQALAA